LFELFFETRASLSRTAHLVQMFARPSAARAAASPPRSHLKSDFDGRPMAFHLTDGEAGDSPIFKLLQDRGPDITPRAALADTGYDAKANRAIARVRRTAPAIPLKSNAKDRPTFFPKALYRGRARIERCFGKLKRFKRVSLRCEKTECGFAAIIALALSFILIESVHIT
jgi:transposase